MQGEGARRSFLSRLSQKELDELPYSWAFWGRPEQIAPIGPWATRLHLAGRGWGKTLAGAQWVRSEIESGRRKNIALVGPTQRDVRKTMVEGESGIMCICPPWFYPRYESSKLMIVWPNGGRAHMYSAEEPNRLRGPNHDAAWCDELAAWSYLRETWDNLEMTLRAGKQPKRYITTTPKPQKLLIDLVNEPTTTVIRGSTFDNADNLSYEFIQRIRERYEGTSLGRQELYGELIAEAEGALWTRRMIDLTRVPSCPYLVRRVLAIDPAVTANEQSDETGMIVAGLDERGHCYIVSDISGRYRPEQWARRAITTGKMFDVDRYVAEVNNGGDMVEHTLRTISPHISYRAVHASRGKAARAEPVAALYEQGKIHHVSNKPELEDQMTTWEPLSGDRSPDRLDAMVWAVTELMIAPRMARQSALVM